MTEHDAALRIAAALSKANVNLPTAFKVVVMVFSEDDETGGLNAGFVSQAEVSELRRWVRAWLRATKPKKETVN